MTVLIKEIPDVDTKRALEALKELEKEGCAGIAVLPVEDEDFRKKIDELGEKNIPVVTFNSDIEDSKRICFVGQDAAQSGKVAAGLMAEIIRPNGIVQVISGYPSNLSHKNRTRGFVSELTKVREDIQILDVQYAFDDDRMAERIVDEMLKEYKDLAGIYLTASGVEGVCRALRKRDCIGKVKVISNDLTPRNKEELKSGSIQFLLGQNAYAQGYDPIMILFDKTFDGKNPEKEYLYTEIVIKTKYNC